MLVVVISIFKTMLVDTQEKIVNMLNCNEIQLDFLKYDLQYQPLLFPAVYTLYRLYIDFVA